MKTKRCLGMMPKHFVRHMANVSHLQFHRKYFCLILLEQLRNASFRGDLASISSQHEQEYIVSLVNRNNYDYYWIGLNDLEQTGIYKWIKTDDTECAYNFKWWSPGMPTDNNGARCTFMLFSDFLPGDEDNGQLGKWNKGICGNNYKFVCQVEESNFSKNCPSEYEYSKETNKCYRFKWNKDDWREAYDKCKDKFRGQLVNIQSEAEQAFLTKRIIEMANNEDKKRDWWVGLSDEFTPGTMTWSLTQSPPTYENWVFGQPQTGLGKGIDLYKL